MNTEDFVGFRRKREEERKAARGTKTTETTLMMAGPMVNAPFHAGTDIVGQSNIDSQASEIIADLTIERSRSLLFDYFMLENFRNCGKLWSQSDASLAQCNTARVISEGRACMHLIRTEP